MNWKKEIDRIGLDFMDVDHCSMKGHYKIGSIYFIVNIEYWKNNYDFRSCKYDIDIKMVDGVWWTDENTTDKVMEFGPGYKEWMLSMIEWLMDEREFLSEYTWGNDSDNDIDWSDYGI